MATITDVFRQKGLWEWFNSGVTQYYDGVSEKGQDYSTTYGTQVGVPVGGKIVRIVHNNNAINDVVELQASDGSVWLYQHITASVRVGDTLQVGSVIGTENGLPIDQYSTGPHIEVRYAGPGSWNINAASWFEPWINPQGVFGSIGNQAPGTVAPGGGGTPLPGSGTQTGNPSLLSYATTTLASNADLQLTLLILDELLVVVNPFIVPNAIQDTITLPGASVPIVGTVGGGSISFTDPIMYIQDVAYNIASDFKSVVLRVLLALLGIYILFKIATRFIDFGALVDTATGAAKTVAAGAALAA